MRRVVVEHEMNVLLAGSLHIDATQKLQELLVPMAPMTRADGLSRLNVERRKERGHSMAQVVVRLPLGHARAHWKDRLRTVQRRRGLDRCRVAGAEPRRRQPSQRSRARGLPARRQGADGFWRFSSPQGRALRGRDRARVHGRAWRRPRLHGPLPPQSALGCIRHEDRARYTLFARRARTLRRPQRTGTEEEPADRNRSQRRDLRSSAALGIRRRRRLEDRHVRGVVRRGCRSRRPDCGRRRRREPARSAQGQRGRAHRQERGALGLGALWR